MFELTHYLKLNCVEFPDADFGHFIVHFIAHEQFVYICSQGFSHFLDVEKSIKMMQMALKSAQTFAFVLPESLPGNTRDRNTA